MESAPHIETLLAHADWVRALARSLVADPAHAEDVAQEAWLAALRSPPADGSNPRGWLAAVVRNAARKLGRGEARRAERELASARGEALPSAAELVAAAAQQRELADLVLELDEPYRRTVLLRFHHGLEVAEIAARTGEPATTVRSRLQRALERLREKLDRRHGERDAWCAALMPLVRAPLSKAAAAPGAVAGSVWLLLWKPALALGLAAGAAVLWVRTWDDAGSAPRPVQPAGERVAVPESPAAPAQEPTRTALERSAPAIPQASGAAAPAAIAVGVVQGRCVDADGRALAGVELVWIDPEAVRVEGEWIWFGHQGTKVTEEDRASYREWPELLEQRIAEYGDRIGAREALRGEPIPRPRTVTGVDGKFSLEVTGTKGTLETTRSDRVVIGTVQSAQDAQQQLVVVPCLQIGGEVVDDRGDPIAGAQVQCSASVGNLSFVSSDARTSSYGVQEQVTTDGAGRFRLARVAYLRGGHFSAYGPDRESVSVDLPAESRDDLRVVVPRRDPARDRAPHIRGRVVDAEGVPVEDAEVRYGQDSVRSDAAGAFDLRLTSGFSDRPALTANKLGLRPASIPNLGRDAYERLASAGGIVLTLGPPMPPIRGKVVDAQGKPCEGWRIELIGAQPYGYFDSITLEDVARGRMVGKFSGVVATDATGAFELSGLADHSYRVRAWDPETFVTIESEAVLPGESELVLQVPSEPFLDRVRGRILSKRGAPVPGIQVAFGRYAWRGDILTTTTWKPSVRADGDGRFELERVPRRGALIGCPVSGVQGSHLELDSLQDPTFVTLEVDLIVRVLVDASGIPGADRLVLLDGGGRRLNVTEELPDFSSGADCVSRGVDGFPPFEVSDAADTLVVMQGDAELRRVPIALRFGEVNSIAP